MALGTLINANNKPAGATLDLDFVTGQMLAMGTAPGTDPVTFDRSTDIEQYWTPGINRATAADALARGSWYYDTDTSTWLPAGAQIWGSRTNQLTYSHDISNAPWTSPGGSPTISSTSIDPAISGKTAYKITSSAIDDYRRQTGLSLGSAAVCLSALIENVDAPVTRIGVKDETLSGVNFVMRYDLTWSTLGIEAVSSPAGTGQSAGFIELGTGPNGGTMGIFYVVGTPSNPANTAGVYVFPTTTAGSVIIHHVQYEVGTYPGPIILTDGSQVTRSADDASVSTAGWYNDGGPGTMVAEVYLPASNTTGSSQYLLYLSDGTTANRIFCRRTTGDLISAESSAGGSVTGPESTTGIYRIAISFDSSGISLVVNGTANSAAGGVPSGITSLHVGQTISNASQPNGQIKSIRYYPRALTTAEMEALTA